jgi:hypothetical protein
MSVLTIIALAVFALAMFAVTLYIVSSCFDCGFLGFVLFLGPALNACVEVLVSVLAAIATDISGSATDISGDT